MTPISRGFGGRRRDDVDPSRIPPGQYYERGFQVLSAGPTPRTPLEEWTFSIQGAVDEARSWTWDEFMALPAEDVTVDIHCVTKWSKLDTRWKGVSVDTLLDGRARSGSGGSRSRPRTSPASGSLPATTTTATPGRSSGTGTTDAGRVVPLAS